MGDLFRANRGYLVAIVTAVALWGGYRLVERWPRPEPVLILPPATATVAPTQTASPAPVLVHVVGAVVRPGVYLLAPGSRLNDAVLAAGGLAEGADPERVNLADFLRDAQQIYVPRLGATPPPGPTPIGRAPAAAVDVQPAAQPGDGQVNINTASQAELETLPGIGPAYAQRIIAYREAHGPFQRLEDLLEVSGIGPTRYKQLESLITIGQ
jgi:competence protein ComEA